MVGLAGLKQEGRHIEGLGLGGLPVDGVLTRGGDPHGRYPGAAEQRPEVQQPLFAEEPDVDIDAVQGGNDADRPDPSFRTCIVYTVSGG